MGRRELILIFIIAALLLVLFQRLVFFEISTST
jgi:hypothetical protein